MLSFEVVEVKTDEDIKACVKPIKNGLCPSGKTL